VRSRQSGLACGPYFSSSFTAQARKRVGPATTREFGRRRRWNHPTRRWGAQKRVSRGRLCVRQKDSLSDVHKGSLAPSLRQTERPKWLVTDNVDAGFQGTLYDFVMAWAVASRMTTASNPVSSCGFQHSIVCSPNKLVLGRYETGRAAAN